MTTPLSLTSSRYTGAAARRSLERASVVSSITSWPIHASGILPSRALGLSLSIIAPSSARSCKYKIPCPKAPRLSADRGYERNEGRKRASRRILVFYSPMRRYQRRAPALVMCATIMFQTLYLDQEVRNDEEESRLTSRKHWRCGTTSVCCTGWRSPTLDRSGFAGPNIFATYRGYSSEVSSVSLPPSGEMKP